MSVVAAQSHRGSLAETLTNTAVGFAINQVAQLILFPLFGIHVALSTSFAIGAAFTAISVARGYFLRRVFQWRQARALKFSTAATRTV
jgi:hypothetical protein